MGATSVVNGGDSISNSELGDVLICGRCVEEKLSIEKISRGWKILTKAFL